MKKLLIIFAIVIGFYLIAPAFTVVEVNEASPLANVDKEAMEETKDDVIEMTDPMPTATIVSEGDFKPDAHEVTGKALVIETENGKLLRFEGFETINGPDLRIYLAADLEANDFVEISKIKATKGNVNYDLPTDIDVTKYNKVLVWCKPFSVLFSYVELE